MRPSVLFPTSPASRCGRRSPDWRSPAAVQCPAPWRPDIQRIGAIEIGWHLPGQLHLAGHDGPGAAEIHIDLLPRLKIQRHSRAGAEAVISPRPEGDPDGDGAGRRLRELEAAVQVRDGLHHGRDRRSARAVEANRLQKDRGLADRLAAVAELAANRRPRLQPQRAGIVPVGREISNRTAGVRSHDHRPRLAGVGERETACSVRERLVVVPLPEDGACSVGVASSTSALATGSPAASTTTPATGGLG